MNLKYFTLEAYKKLKADIKINEEEYITGSNEWLDGYFKKNGIDEYCKTSSIVVPNVSLEYNGDDIPTINADDKQNAINIYNAYKNCITPLVASNPMLWTALCHMDYYDYIVKRWKNEKDKIEITKRFFATRARNSLCYYNAIARLWWSGYLTYEEEKAKSNPWELIDILFSAQQIQKDLFDQPFSMNPVVVKGLLLALKKIQEERGNNATNVFRACCDSYFNHYAAVTIVDVLSVADVQELAYNYMHNHK